MGLLRDSSHVSNSEAPNCPRRAPRGPAMLLLAAGAMSPASSCISTVNSLVTALTGWEEACRRSNCPLEALEKPANCYSHPLNSPAQALPPLSSTVHSSNLAAWWPSHTQCTSDPRQRTNRTAPECCNLPGGDFLHLPNFDIELWRCGGTYIKAGWLGHVFTVLLQSPRFSRSTGSIPE
jgi:hypothetical protein